MTSSPLIEPLDTHNKALLDNVHPPEWVNPTPAQRYNLVVIGAGTAGLVTAAGAAGLGAKVALVERHLMGGDCLNVGCVPSKALIRASRVMRDVGNAADFGVQAAAPAADFEAVMQRVRRLRAGLSDVDSARRFTDLGVDIFIGEGRFTGPDRVQVGEHTLRFKKACIATGARAVRPPIEGLAEAGFLTNETVFNLTKQPARMAVIGGGPIGCELAQAFQALGTRVTLVEVAPQFLSREDPDAAEVLFHSMKRDGVDVRLSTRVERAEVSESGKVLTLATEQGLESLEVDQILVGVGRAPNVDGMGLKEAGVEYDVRAGVKTNDSLQTTNPSIFAAGDITLQHKFTHTADFSARIVIQNALFMGRKKASTLTIPWCTFTSPEIAHVGLYEEAARREGIDVRTFKISFADVDRAVLEGDDEGFVKIHVREGSDEILGATIVAEHAGEMISEITLAMVAGVGLGTIASVIHPYPTQAEAIRKAGDAYNRTRLTPMVRSVMERWLSWTR